MNGPSLSRRQFLMGSAALGTITAMAGCAPQPAASPTPEALPPAEEPTAAPTQETVPTPQSEATQPPVLTVPEGACDNHDIFVPLMPHDEEVTLTSWDSCESETISKRYDELANEFSEVYPNVKIEGQHAQSPENFVAACAAGTPPDLWSGGWNPERIGIWAYTGCLLPIDELMEEVDFPKDRFIPGCWETVLWDGKTWGLPNGVGIYMLWYNPNHLKEIGMEFPKDTDELWAAADELTTRDAEGNIDRLGMRLTTWFWEHLTWICAFGGEIWDLQKNEPTPDHPGVIAALEDMVAAVKRYGVETLDRWASSIGGLEGVQSSRVGGSRATTQQDTAGSTATGTSSRLTRCIPTGSLGRSTVWMLLPLLRRPRPRVSRLYRCGSGRSSSPRMPSNRAGPGSMCAGASPASAPSRAPAPPAT